MGKKRKRKKMVWTCQMCGVDYSEKRFRGRCRCGCTQFKCGEKVKKPMERRQMTEEEKRALKKALFRS